MASWSVAKSLGEHVLGYIHIPEVGMLEPWVFEVGTDSPTFDGLLLLGIWYSFSKSGDAPGMCFAGIAKT